MIPMFHEYDLMFHYLLASLRRTDGVNSVTSNGEKIFDVFAGLGDTGEPLLHITFGLFMSDY